MGWPGASKAGVLRVHNVSFLMNELDRWVMQTYPVFVIIYAPTSALKCDRIVDPWEVTIRQVVRMPRFAQGLSDVYLYMEN